MQAKKTVSSQGEERIKKMMLYIRDHYSEKISLEEIAVSANISGRECLRCFRDMLNISPFGYLMDYRIRRAAGLLRETDRTVTDIAFTCGFFGTSYFGKSRKHLREGMATISVRESDKSYNFSFFPSSHTLFSVLFPHASSANS